MGSVYTSQMRLQWQCARELQTGHAKCLGRGTMEGFRCWQQDSNTALASHILATNSKHATDNGNTLKKQTTHIFKTSSWTSFAVVNAFCTLSALNPLYNWNKIRVSSYLPRHDGSKALFVGHRPMRVKFLTPSVQRGLCFLEHGIWRNGPARFQVQSLIWKEVATLDLLPW
jgi:hypothetical protein